MAKTEETTAPVETDLLGDPIVEPVATGPEAFQTDMLDALTRMQGVMNAFHDRLSQVEALLKQNAEGDIPAGFEMDPAARISALEALVLGGPAQEDGAQPPGVEARLALLEEQVEELATEKGESLALPPAPSFPKTLDELPSPFVQS